MTLVIPCLSLAVHPSGLPVYLSHTNPPAWEPLPLSYAQPHGRHNNGPGRDPEGGESSQTPGAIHLHLHLHLHDLPASGKSVASSVPSNTKAWKDGVKERKRKQPGKDWYLLLELVSLASWLEQFGCLSYAVGTSVVTDRGCNALGSCFIPFIRGKPLSSKSVLPLGVKPKLFVLPSFHCPSHLWHWIIHMRFILK